MLNSTVHARRKLIDGIGRRIDHLRVSVTARCDLRCLYCRPFGESAEPVGRNLLTDAQRLDFIRFMHEYYGLAQVRITGGEPLVYQGLLALVDALHTALPDLSLAMTSNGRLLRSLAKDLRSAGLDRLNISLDSQDPQTYRKITGGELQLTLDGIHAALEAGFPAPRINMVVLRGLNDGELPVMMRWAFAEGFELRFLEAMPIGDAAAANRSALVTAAEMRALIGKHFTLSPLSDHIPGTARRYRATSSSGSGMIGIIAPLTESFCGDCRRVRLTADGKFFPCLLDSRHVNVTEAWSGSDFDPACMTNLVEDAVAGKQAEGSQHQATAMVRLGG